MLSYPAAVDLSSRTLRSAADLLRRHRRVIGSRWRKLSLSPPGDRLLLDAGVPPHIVRAIAGHSGIEVTMTIYAHAAREEQRQALLGLAQGLG